MSTTLALDECKPGLSNQLADAIRSHHLNSRTGQTYQHWITQYLAYYDLVSPSVLSERNIRDFLRHARKQLALSKARLNQAREAIIFLYEKVLRKPIQTKELIVA